MGHWDETAAVYADGRKNGAADINAGTSSIPERNRMGLVQALMVLHKVRRMEKLMGQVGIEDCGEAFDVVFAWIDDMVLLLEKIGGKHTHNG